MVLIILKNIHIKKKKVMTDFQNFQIHRIRSTKEANLRI